MWGSEHRFLPYKREPLSDFDRTLYERAGYKVINDTSFTVQHYNGPVIMKWAQHLDIIFGLFDQHIEFQKIGLLDIVPTHVPNAKDYCDNHDVDPNNIWHCIMLLENWDSGQYLEIGKSGITNWQAGTWYKFKPGTTISYGNFGNTNMYVTFLTAKDVYTGQLNTLIPFNMPSHRDTPESNHPLVTSRIKPVINPFNDPNIINMVYMHNGPIKELDSYVLKDNSINRINKDGMSFWLYEPMCSYYEGEEHTQGYYSEFKHPHDLSRMRSKELDSILEYQQKNNIAIKMIKVYSGEYNIAQHYPHYTHALNLVCNDLYLQTLGATVNLEEALTDDYLNYPFTKHFISLNWRFTKHRQFVANFLAGENGYLSWYFKNNFENLTDTFWADIESWKETHPIIYNKLLDNNKVLETNSPYVVDKFTTNAHYNGDGDMWPNVEEYEQGQTPSLFNTKEIGLYNFYKDTFLDIVTETRFAEPSANFSEKLLQPVQYMKPFVVVAPPKTLEYFKSFGYQTFSDFWDESYDDELDHDKRLAKLLTLVNSILNKSIEELRTMYQQMRLIVEHNKRTYLKNVTIPNYNDTEWYG